MLKLTEERVKDALTRVEIGLQKYENIQRNLHHVNVAENLSFQRKFNHFYRIRRNAEWRFHFYSIFEKYKSAQNLSLLFILEEMKTLTNRIEASFCSKLLASLNTDLPVLDSVVLKNLNLNLPSNYAENRIQKTINTYNDLISTIEEIKKSPDGKLLSKLFGEKFGEGRVSKTKEIDLVLWQCRD